MVTYLYHKKKLCQGKTQYFVYVLKIGTTCWCLTAFFVDTYDFDKYLQLINLLYAGSITNLNKFLLKDIHVLSRIQHCEKGCYI